MARPRGVFVGAGIAPAGAMGRVAPRHSSVGAQLGRGTAEIHPSVSLRSLKALQNTRGILALGIDFSLYLCPRLFKTAAVSIRALTPAGTPAMGWEVGRGRLPALPSSSPAEGAEHRAAFPTPHSIPGARGQPRRQLPSPCLQPRACKAIVPRVPPHAPGPPDGAMQSSSGRLCPAPPLDPEPALVPQQCLWEGVLQRRYPREGWCHPSGGHAEPPAREVPAAGDGGGGVTRARCRRRVPSVCSCSPDSDTQRSAPPLQGSLQ